MVFYIHQHVMQGTSIKGNLVARDQHQMQDPYNDTVALYSVLGISVRKDKQVRKIEEGKE